MPMMVSSVIHTYVHDKMFARTTFPTIHVSIAWLPPAYPQNTSSFNSLLNRTIFHQLKEKNLHMPWKYSNIND